MICACSKKCVCTEVVSTDMRVEGSSLSSRVIWRSDSYESVRTVLEKLLSMLRIVYCHENVGMEGRGLICTDADANDQAAAQAKLAATRHAL
jgi:hypothetical protein